jgi:hypothetical protein
MSDDPVLAALTRLEAKLDAGIARVEAEQSRMREEQTRMREQFGNKLDDILDKLRAVREDTDNTQAHVLYGLQQTLTLGQRITKLEDQMRRAGH